MTSAPATASSTRPAPLGGFSLTFVGFELRRTLRNKRSLIFTFVMPTAFFLLFGTTSSYTTTSAGNGNVTAWVMVSMALYGAMLASTSAGAAVATERALGWSRQLRMTPLQPFAYVAVKTTVALLLGAASIIPVFVVGNVVGAQLSWERQLASAVLIWLCAAVFAAFGLAMGYLLPSENVMQILGPALALLAFAGGLFVPLSQMGHTFETIAKYTPAYGAGEIARLPFGHIDNLAAAIVNVAAWTAVFAAIAAWRMSKDTARV
jgi:ABC-2 type transport system permease protein